MTQYDDPAPFVAAGEPLGASPEAGAFFATLWRVALTSGPARSGG